MRHEQWENRSSVKTFHAHPTMLKYTSYVFQPVGILILHAQGQCKPDVDRCGHWALYQTGGCKIEVLSGARASWAADEHFT